MKRAISVGLLVLGNLVQLHGGNHGKEKGYPPPQVIKGDQGEPGPIGPAGPAGQDASNHGLTLGLGGGLRHQEKWFDLEALIYKDVKNGGVTGLGLVVIKPFKSAQDRQIERLNGQIQSLVAAVYLAHQEAQKALGLAQTGTSGNVKRVQIRKSGIQ